MGKKKTKEIRKETRWHLLADLEYYFGPYYEFPPKEQMCSVFGLSAEEYNLAIATGNAENIANDAILDEWVLALKKLFRKHPAATKKDVSVKIGVPMEVAKKIRKRKDEILEAKMPDDAYGVIFDAFRNSFETFRWIREIKRNV